MSNDSSSWELDLNEIFLKHGSNIKPGEGMDLRDWQVKTEQAVNYTNVIKNQVAEANEDMEKKGLFTSPFCNPVILIFQRLEFIARYFCGEFEIQTKDKRFREKFAGI